MNTVISPDATECTAPQKVAASPAERIAIFTDSCTDTPAYLKDSHPIYTVALHVNYSDGSFLDRVTITPQEVYARLKKEVPKTSTPTVQEVREVFAQIVHDGFTHVICIDISSALSGTLNLVEQVARTFPELTTEFVDTLNIGFGGGFMVRRACHLLDEGLPFAEVVEGTRAAVKNTHTFFIVDTLDFLYKGGRISKAVYALGSVLNIKPIITCDEHGKYAAASKGRGKKGALNKARGLITKITGGKPFDLAVANGNAIEEAAEILDRAKAEFPNVRQILDVGQISPVLTVHTGPGMIGLAAQLV